MRKKKRRREQDLVKPWSEMSPEEIQNMYEEVLKGFGLK